MPGRGLAWGGYGSPEGLAAATQPLPFSGDKAAYADMLAQQQRDALAQLMMGGGDRGQFAPSPQLGPDQSFNQSALPSLDMPPPQPGPDQSLVPQPAAPSGAFMPQQNLVPSRMAGGAFLNTPDLGGGGNQAVQARIRNLLSTQMPPYYQQLYGPNAQGGVQGFNIQDFGGDGGTGTSGVSGGDVTGGGIPSGGSTPGGQPGGGQPSGQPGGTPPDQPDIGPQGGFQGPFSSDLTDIIGPGGTAPGGVTPGSQGGSPSFSNTGNPFGSSGYGVTGFGGQPTGPVNTGQYGTPGFGPSGFANQGQGFNNYGNQFSPSQLNSFNQAQNPDFQGAFSTAGMSLGDLAAAWGVSIDSAQALADAGFAPGFGGGQTGSDAFGSYGSADAAASAYGISADSAAALAGAGFDFDSGTFGGGDPGGPSGDPGGPDDDDDDDDDS